MGRRKGDPRNRIKSLTGKNKARIENDYGIINITAFNHYPETICLDFVSAMFFKNIYEFDFNNI